ncbi:uncharacterized protein [Hoplias malabaricus]|uniref:uncharacterized protein n=1 Tax=Hoplias malabaricus TaxID=27720 RepID=UPI0034627C26
MDKLAEDIFQYTAFPQNHQIEDVAQALIKKFPCLKESGSVTGYYGWMISLKYKMANYRTKMRSIGCPEVTLNSVKNKSSDECFPAKNVKNPKKAEVNFCPDHPSGENAESLEKLRLELLKDVRQRNSTAVVREKMSKTFSYRRREVVQESPVVGDFKMKWPALFQIDEIGAEFQRITTVPLETTFMAQLDSLVPQLAFVFKKKGGVSGQKIAKHLKILHEDIQGDILQDQRNTRMGIYVLKREGGTLGEYKDIGIVVDGDIVLDSIKSVAQACAVMLGVIYALNLAYPRELKYYYEFVQKVLMQMDGAKLSPKVLGLKNKILGESK